MKQELNVYVIYRYRYSQYGTGKYRQQEEEQIQNIISSTARFTAEKGPRGCRQCSIQSAT